MIIEIQENSWLDMGQVLAVYATARPQSKGYAVCVYTSFQTDKPLTYELTRDQWNTFSTVWKEHVGFMNGQEEFAKASALKMAAMQQMEFEMSEPKEGEEPTVTLNTKPAKV